DFDLNPRVPGAERGQRRRQDVLTGDGAGGQSQLARESARRTRHFGPGLRDEVEDASRVPVEAPAGVGERGPAALAAEEGGAQGRFELVDALADGRLRDAEVPGRGGKAAAFRGLGKRLEVWQGVRGHRGSRSDWESL